jgi:hypothetical protein
VRAPNLLFTFIGNQRCQGCGAINVYVEERRLTCFYCTGIVVATEDRKRKLRESLQWKMSEFYRRTAHDIRIKLDEFNRRKR